MLSLRSAHSLVLISILAARAIQSSIAFATSSIQIRPLSHSAMTTQRASSNPEDEKEEGIPCLPPIGESSYTGEPTLNDDSETLRIGSEKFELQYTCKVCETRNFHKVSRMAYRNGIVITVCKGCLSKHLIADNLGWTKYLGGFNGDSNIEEYMQTHGRADEVNRVTREVFDLEGILKNNANNIFDLEGILENNSSSDDLDTGAERSFE